MKKVLLSISVPDGDYCWGGGWDTEICGQLDTEGGYPTCMLDLGRLQYEKERCAVKKCDKCKNLLTSPKQ
jgi:hypothetical protein